VEEFVRNVSDDRTAAIADYVFKESAQKYKQAELHGRKFIRHSPLVIRLAIVIYESIGYAECKFELLAKCFGFPTSRSI
jgi:hypothetical protein